MSIFAKPLSQIGASDLQELLQEPSVENLRLEFKSMVPDKDETLKKLSSFANSFGGYMVVGAKATSADGRIESLPGVAEQAGYKQKIVQWSFDSVSPPLVVEVSDPVPTTDPGNVVYVIYTAESDVAPHFLNGRKGVWVRSDEFSQRYKPQLATENEIRHLLDRRRLIQERRNDIQQRSRRRFERLRSTAGGTPIAGPSLEVSIGPRFPARPVCEHAQSAAELRNLRVDYRGTIFPLGRASVVSQHESILYLTPADIRNRIAMIEATIWGMTFYGAEMEVETGPQQTSRVGEPTTRGIHLYLLVGYLLVFAEHAKQTISRVGYEGALTLDVRLSGILGIPLLYNYHGMGMAESPVSELDEEFSFSLSATTEELRGRRDALVIGMLRYILFGMNWADYAADTSKLEDLVRSGYEYNFWGKPKTLQV